MKQLSYLKIFTITIIPLLTIFSCSQKKSNPDSITLKPDRLTIGTEYGYPPFEYIAEDGKTLIGFDVDMWNELCRRMELKPVYYDTQWPGLFSGLEANRFDCVISAVTITPQRKEKFLITKPYVQNSECFVVNPSSGLTIDDPAKLEGLKVAYQAETVSDVYVTELKDTGLKFETFEYDKLLDAFDDLKFGRVNVVVAESVASKIIEKTDPEKYRIDFIGEPDAFFGLLVNRNNPELFEKIQRTLDQMYEDGWMKENEKKWLEGE